MINKTMKKSLATLTLAFVALLGSQTATAGWINWTSTTTGTMDIGGITVGVTLTGPADTFEDGDYYYNNAFTGYTANTGTYLGLMPSDMIKVVGPSAFTLTFDQAVTDLTMALVSVGQQSRPVTYDFNSAFTASAAGNNYWGTGSYSINGDDFIGVEYNGILSFSGAFSSISFSTDPGENWHGFNFASNEVAVPAPTSLALLGLGLMGFAASRRRKKL